MIRFFSTVATCALLVTSPVSAQGVPTVDTRNIAQEIRQLQQMLEDFGIQTDQLDTLLEQLDLVQQQLDTLNETYAALTGATDIIEMAMGGDLDGLLDQEFGDLLGTIRQIQSGDFSGLIGNAAPQMEGRITQALEDAGFDQDSLSDMASSGNPGAERIASQASTGAVMSAAAGVQGGARAQSMLRLCLNPFRPHVIPGPEIMLGQSGQQFDENGKLTNDGTHKFLGELMGQLRELAEAR